MSQVSEVLTYVRSLNFNPLAVVIVAGLLAAFIEQRLARRGTPDYNAAYRNLPVYPNLPPRKRWFRKPRQPPQAPLLDLDDDD
jgi:hypothetical protein